MVQEDKLTKVSRYVIHVLKSVLHNKTVDELKEEGITYQDVIAFSKFHQIDNIVFTGIEKYLEDDLKTKWKKKIPQNIVGSFSQIEEKNVLVLDEPTRNLSPLSLPTIIKILKEFKGCIISISHDRRYIKEVSSRIYKLTKEGLIKM